MNPSVKTSDWFLSPQLFHSSGALAKMFHSDFKQTLCTDCIFFSASLPTLFIQVVPKLMMHHCHHLHGCWAKMRPAGKLGGI